ncbi:hypothetical protein R1sor_024302 [Riccia sorocarpa]|uniref:Elongation factor-like 1 n=1 Tax=Riccia sorocarpa TaxID=122646 RepID=A0ABD3GS03_9MARC
MFTTREEQIRDHGKTTMADHLIAAAGGGVLHSKQAGKLRFMDYRDDEQQRAITMKSACIVLRFRDHVINLIDSPGHVDFCSEVSTAVRLSDGAVVLVDTVEGVHIQTHAVLRQAWLERLKPCLVLNKIDRLITELKFTPAEAYARCQSIIMEVNNIINAFRSEKYLSDVDSILTKPTATGEEADDEEEEDEEDAFAPERGNVAFGSAGDGWAFRIDQFADLYAAKLGASAKALKKALWGHHYFVPKTKKIVGKKAAAGKLKPMFVQFVLEPLWQVYDAAMQGSDGVEMLNKIIKSMNLTIPPRELQHKDPRSVLQAVMSRWLPLSETVLGMVVECLPDPASAMHERVERLLPEEVSLTESNKRSEGERELERVRKAVETCDSSEEAPCVVFVSKMVALPVEMLPRHNAQGELISNAEISAGDMDAGGRECFLAFARVFSGTLREGQRMYVLSALYNPTAQEPDNKHIQVATIESLYLMMGRGLEPLEKATAGHLIAIRGLGQQILKTATLSSTPYCWPFASMRFQAAPIVRVAIEPSDPADMGALAKGLRLLNRADPFVEVTVSNSGEHVLSAAGEVHLERCIKDLKDRFARVELEVSPPLVGFRETIELEEVSGTVQNNVTQIVTPNGRATIRVHVTRLPDALTQVLDGSHDSLRNIIDENKAAPRLSKASTQGSLYAGENSGDDPVTSLRNRLLAAIDSGFEEGKKEEVRKWTEILKRIWVLGPRRVGPNLLLTPEEAGSAVKEGGSLSSVNGDSEDVAVVRGSPLVSEKLGLVEKQADRNAAEDEHSPLFKEVKSLESSVIAGFQLATAQGPLCEEPVWGLAFTVEVFVNTRERVTADSAESFPTGVDAAALPAGIESYGGALSGQIISGVKDACRSAILSKNPRLVEALYFCEISTTADYLGQVYAVLNRRRARVLKEEMMEGSALFIVHAYMPVSESFGFADDLRRKTSGFASPQLVLSHWESLPEDPFFVPRTEEELEEFGDGSSVLQNTARKLIDSVRRRKGLPVEEKIVQFATKQRTRARKV